MKEVLAPLYRLLEFAEGYALNQRLGKPTTDRFRALLAHNFPNLDSSSVLDLGCGIGNYRDCFTGRYTGIDINPAYIKRTRATLPGIFEIMDCTSLGYPDRSFDEVVTIATTHHLDDTQFARMIAEGLRVCRVGGSLHIIDAILPISPNFLFKRIWFGLDRGRFPRTLDHHLQVIGRAGIIHAREILTGPLHDTAYVRVGRLPDR